MSVKTIMVLVNKSSVGNCFHKSYPTFVLDWFDLARQGGNIDLYIDESYEDDDNNGDIVTANCVKSLVERLCNEEGIKLPKITLC